MSYCVGLEISGENYYLKAESATTFNDWVRVSHISIKLYECSSNLLYFVFPQSDATVTNYLSTQFTATII